MISAKRIVCTTVVAALVAAAAASQIPLKVHSFDVVAASATVCTDGAVFDGMTTAGSSVGPLMTSEIWDAAGTNLLATGNTHTFGAVNETFTFTVAAALTAGSTVALVVTNVPGSNAPLGGSEGDTTTATVANCSIAMPAMPAWGLALLAATLLAAGTLRAVRGRGLVAGGGGRPLLGLLLLLGAAVVALPAAAGASKEPPIFSKSFSPNPIGPGSTSMLTFVIDNSAHGVGVDMLAFDDEFPTGMSFAAPAFVSNTCSGTLTLDEDDADSGFDVRLTDGMLGANQSCQIVVNVTAVAIDNADTNHQNVSGELTSDAGNSGSVSADLMVRINRPGFSKSFAPNPVEFGAVSTLTFQVDNTLNASAVTFLTFSDTLPTGMVIADPDNAATDCESSVIAAELTAESGTNVISLSANGVGAFPVVAAGNTCTVSVDVVAGAVGDLGNVSLPLFSTPGGDDVGKASAVLEVTGFDTLLQILKRFTDDPVPPGGTVNLEFEITNKSRDFPATDVSFDDLIDPLGALTGLTPVGLPASDVCGMGSTLSFASGTLSLTGGNLPAEGSCVFSIALSVPATATPGGYSNTTSAIEGTIDGATEIGNIAGDILSVVSFPILTKTFTNDPVGAGGTVTLEFTIFNTSTSAITDIAFIDELTDSGPNTGFLPFPVSVGLPPTPNPPCGGASSLVLSFLGGTNVQGLSLTGGSLAASDGTLGGGDTCTFSVTVDVPAGFAGGTYTNTTRRVSAKIGATTVTGKRAKGTIAVLAAPQLSKEFTDDPVAPGGTVTLEFTIAHDEFAGGPASAIAFDDDLAAAVPGGGLTATAVGTNTCTGSTVDITTDPTKISFSGGSLAPDTECKFSVTISVPGGAPSGIFTNTTSNVTATVGGLTTTGGAAEDNLRITGLLFSKEFLGDPVIAGAPVTLKFTLDNTTGTADATGLFFTDSLGAIVPPSPGVTATGPPTPPMPCGFTDSSSPTFLSYTGGAVLAGTSCSFTVPLLVPATIDPAGPPPPFPTPDDLYLNVTSSLSASIGGAPTTLPPAADGLEVNSTLIEITKEFLGDPVAPGGMVTLKFTLENISASDTVTDIAFSDNLGAALAGLSATGVVVNDCGGMGPGFPTSMFSYSGGGPLMPGASCAVSLSVTVPAAPLPAGPYINTTSSVTGKVGLLDVFGDPASDELLVQLLKLEKEFTDDPTTATGTVTLEFTLTNLGTDPVSDLAFSDNLAAAIPGLEATTLPPVGVCGPGSALTGSSFLTFTGGSLAGGAFCVIPVTLTVPASAPDGIFVNKTGNLREAGLPVAPGATAFLEIEPPPTFAKSFSPDPVGVGADTTLTFTINNMASVVAASNLDFLDTLPIGLEVAPAPMVANTCGGDVVAMPGSVSISLANGSVAAGAVCTLSVNVRATGNGLVVNTTSDLTSSSGNSGPASDSVTILGCNAANGDNLTLSPGVVLGTQVFEVCNTITVPQHYLVLGPSGNLTLRAGVAVIINNGVEFGRNSVVTIVLDPSLIP